MKILFDHQAFDKQTHGGISRSFVQLSTHLQNQDVDVEIAVRETDNVYLRELGFLPNGHRLKHFISKKDFPGKFNLFRIYNKINNIGYGNDYNRRFAIEHLKHQNFDVFHPTFFQDYFLDDIGNKPFVLTVHDMTPEMHPEHFLPSNFEITKKRVLIPKANAIVAVSENTKQDILRFYPYVDPDKIHVIYHGPSFPEGMKPADTPATKDYILYVGHRWRYKNFGMFVNHLSHFMLDHPEINVICAGEPFHPFEIVMFKEYGLEGRFTAQFVKSDEEFINLYHNALAFVYPSCAEGFGMPVLEAFQSRTPCVLNKASCFPEVGSDAAIYFDLSDDKSNLSEVIEGIYNWMPEQREAQLVRQDRRLADFSWSRSAHQLKSLYQSLI